MCREYSPPEGYKPNLVNPAVAENYDACVSQFAGSNRALVPFMTCGDLAFFDADRTYPLELNSLSEDFKDWKYECKEIVQPPTEPAYKKAANLKRNSGLEKEVMSASHATAIASSTAAQTKNMKKSGGGKTREVEDGCDSSADKFFYGLFDE